MPIETRHWKRRQVLGGMVGAAGLAMVGPVRAAPSGQPIKVGATLALTGPLAQTSLIQKLVAEICVEDLNKRNGLVGRPVEFVLLDDQSKPDVARSLYEKLITVDKVDLILGPYGTGNILATMGVAQRFNKLFLQGSLGMPHLGTYERQFPASPVGPEPNKSTPPKIFDVLAASKTPPKTVSVVTSKFPSAQFIAAGVRETAEARGLKVNLYLEYEFGTRDFGSIAARIKDANADFLYVGSLGVDSNSILEALRKLEYAPPRHYHQFPAPGPLALAPVGDHALSWTFLEDHPPFLQRPEDARIADAFRTQAKSAGLPYPYFDFQAAAMLTMWQLLEASATATKGIDDDAMAKWLKANKVETVFGKMDFAGKFNHGEDLSKVRQVQDKKWVTVWPTEFAPPGVKAILP